jgi:hypothetical protein
MADHSEAFDVPQPVFVTIDIAATFAAKSGSSSIHEVYGESSFSKLSTAL